MYADAPVYVYVFVYTYVYLNINLCLERFVVNGWCIERVVVRVCVCGFMSMCTRTCLYMYTHMGTLKETLGLGISAPAHVYVHV